MWGDIRLGAAGRLLALMLGGLLALYLLPLIISDTFHRDDIFRSIGGYTNWRSDGRVLADVFYALFTGSVNIAVDLHPLPLIIAAAFFTAIAVMVREAQGIPAFPLCIASFCIVANPFFLANLFFRYDGPFMLLASATAILPFALLGFAPVRLLLSAVLITASMALYQAAAGIFIAMAAIELLHNVSRDVPPSIALRRLVARVSALVLGYLLYSQVLTKVFPLHAYAASFGTLALVSGDWAEQLLINVQASLRMTQHLAVWPMPFFLAPLLITAAAGGGLTVFRARYRTIAFLAVVAVAVAALLALLGVGIFSGRPMELARGYVGVGGFLAILVIMASYTGRASILGYVPMLLGLFSIGFAASNAADADYRHYNRIASSIMDDLARYQVAATSGIAIIGTAPRSRLADHAIAAFPIIEAVEQRIFDNNYDTGRFILIMAGANPELEFRSPPADLGPEVVTRPEYGLYVPHDGLPTVVFNIN
jgi:hypothetical protein